MAGTYTYDPQKLTEYGKDRMRFELGDTMIEGEAETSALMDEEIMVVLEMYPKQWKKAKLACLESICRRFAYEPDTKEGPLSLALGERAKLWREDYENLKSEVSRSSISVPRSAANSKPPYFYTGMQGNKEAE